MNKDIVTVVRGKNAGEERIVAGLEFVWRLTLDCWSFREKYNAEPRLQRHIVVLNKASS